MASVGPARHITLIGRTHLAADTECMSTFRTRRVSPHPRRTLELLDLLAISPRGATEALLVRAHGFNSDMIADIIRVGLATAESETVVGAKPAEVVRIKITEAGQDALKTRHPEPQTRI
jgi:hypothetical protein